MAYVHRIMVNTWIRSEKTGIKIQRKRKHVLWVFFCMVVAVTVFQYILDTHHDSSITLPPCELDKPLLNTKIPVNKEAKPWHTLERLLSTVSYGGSWKPNHCKSQQDIAIYMPFRDRDEHLRVFLAHIHPFLQKQQIAYTIYTIEQDPLSVFNRGLLGNIGYTETKKFGHDCFIFHDVDLLPENERNLYKCEDNPKHMSTYVDSLGYSLPYKEISGGIGAFRSEHLSSINGFSNYFFRWGGEDDDLFGRFHSQGWTIIRDPDKTGKYTQLKHDKADKNPLRFAMISHNRNLRQKTDGLSSLHEFYRLDKVIKHKLYTQIKVKVNDKKADFVINSIVQEVREGLPTKYKRVNASLIIQAVQRVGMFYTRPIQAGTELKKMLQEMHIQI